MSRPVVLKDDIENWVAPAPGAYIKPLQRARTMGLLSVGLLPLCFWSPVASCHSYLPDFLGSILVFHVLGLDPMLSNDSEPEDLRREAATPTRRVTAPGTKWGLLPALGCP